MPSYLTPEARTLRFSHLSFPSVACCTQLKLNCPHTFMSAALTMMQLRHCRLCAVPPCTQGHIAGIVSSVLTIKGVGGVVAGGLHQYSSWTGTGRDVRVRDEVDEI